MWGEACHHVAVEVQPPLHTNYPDATQPAVEEITVRLAPRETVGFVGPSGAGKSTVVDIMLGLLVPDRGAVYVDGQDIDQDPRAWHAQIGYVPQSILLTDDTVRGNVAFGIAPTAIDDDAVWRALEAVQLGGLVRAFPRQTETLIGERGARLSGGQRQRLGIARALYHDPTVLVLDEATNALDPAMEAEVMHAVRALHGSRTIVIVAHRPSTITYCERLYWLKDGRITREGAAPRAS